MKDFECERLLEDQDLGGIDNERGWSKPRRPEWGEYSEQVGAVESWTSSVAHRGGIVSAAALVKRFLS